MGDTADPFTPKEGYGQVMFYSLLGRPQIIRLDESRVLKTACTDQREPDAMRYVASNTTIPVPIATCHQLRGYLSQLKRLKGKRIEAVGGGRITVGLRFPKQGGPFNSEKEFNDFMVEKDNDRTPAVFKRYARAGLKDNHVMHFAHGDFSLCNILVDGTGRVAAVLDWDRAGWYPEYWDTARMLCENPGIRDYWPYLEHILLLQYAQEVVALSYVFSLSGDG